jgi:hypothetical protein
LAYMPEICLGIHAPGPFRHIVIMAYARHICLHICHMLETSGCLTVTTLTNFASENSLLRGCSCSHSTLAHVAVHMATNWYIAVSARKTQRHACGVPHPLPCRYVIQALPLMLVGGVVLALMGTRLLQTVQSKVFHVIPFGLLSKFNITDACVGILVSGAFMLYFGRHY